MFFIFRRLGSDAFCVFCCGVVFVKFFYLKKIFLVPTFVNNETWLCFYFYAEVCVGSLLSGANVSFLRVSGHLRCLSTRTCTKWPTFVCPICYQSSSIPLRSCTRSVKGHAYLPLLTLLSSFFVELGQMVSMLKYRGTTWYQYLTVKVSQYRPTAEWLIFNVIPGYQG